MSEDEKYMSRCLQLAQRAEGRTFPNPMVGAVIVADGRIIGEGWHRKAGQPHAEVNAVNSVAEADRPLLASSTIYVSLEPCAHFGRTPPCADLIVRMGIPRVVVGCVDSFSKVSGRGIEILREAGREVIVGVLEDECRRLNRRFFTFHELLRPYVILKWAQSADAKMGLVRPDGSHAPVAISNSECLTEAHRQRTTENAILVGAGTVASDDPQLTPRRYAGPHPLRVVLDPDLRVAPSAKLLSDGADTLVVNRSRDDSQGPVRHIRAEYSFGHPEQVHAVLSALHSAGVMSVIVEGGARTLTDFIASGLWDEAHVFQSSNLLGADALPAPSLAVPPVRQVPMADCSLRQFVNHL